MRYLLMLLTLIIGTFIPIQAVLNTKLGRQIGGPLMGSLMSFFVGFVCLLILNFSVNTQAVVHIKPSTTYPWYIWMGGVIGAIFVGYITWVNQQQGVALTFALVVSGQIFASLIIDHYGLFGSVVKSITTEKIIGAVLILAGLVLIKRS
ncbi:DMT family transporter [Danxiaibacter flavus]|uniref:DMT family transporter n=1 Tax=Danxiaibacter flavus TaxID=3049108 RepID=A0ABV3ZLL7_9BACT|nr:DMT family transporter [Chitinophagaceae bacterium DXS]